MPHLPSKAWLSLPLVLFMACGGRSSPKVYERPDGGVSDGGTRDLEAICEELVYSTPRLMVDVEAEVRSTTAVVSAGWRIGANPPGSTPEIVSDLGARASFLQDTVGTYELIFEVENAAGRRAACSTIVESVVGPPIAICPEEPVQVGLGEPVTIEGDAFDDDGEVRVRWSGTGPGMFELAPNTSLQPVFRGLDGGEYTLTLTVTDIDDATDSCDVTVRVSEPPTVICPEVIEGPTRERLRITAQAFDDVGIATTSFELLESPPASRTNIGPSTSAGSEYSAPFTPDRAGDYRVLFTATDEVGLSDSCEIIVVGTPSPPTLDCPDVETRPLTRTDVGCNVEDDGEIVSWTWSLVDTPMGSGAGQPNGDTQDARFTPDIAGEYVLEVIAVDDQGFEVRETILVSAIATEGLRVEVTWDSSGDMDTHLLAPTARMWGDNNLDCYYANCIHERRNWGSAASAEDDPSLDLDNTTAFGPENTNIETPADGTYRVGVHAFSGTSNVTVNVYCGGSTTVPRQTFGPVNVTDRLIWRVADVEISGNDCRITDLSRAGRPNYVDNGGPR